MTAEMTETSVSTIIVPPTVTSNNVSPELNSQTALEKATPGNFQVANNAEALAKTIQSTEDAIAGNRIFSEGLRGIAGEEFPDIITSRNGEMTAHQDFTPLNTVQQKNSV